MKSSTAAPLSGANPLQLLAVVLTGLTIGALTVWLAPALGSLSSFTGRNIRFRVFSIGILTILLITLTPATRRYLTDRLGEISIPVFIAIGAMQLSALKVGLITMTGLASIPLFFYWFIYRATYPKARSTFTPFGMILILLILCTLWSSVGDGYFLVRTIMQVYLKCLTAIVLVDLLDTKEKIRKAIFIVILFLALNMLVASIQQILSLGFDTHLSVAGKSMAFRKGVLASTGLGKTRNIFGQTSAIFTAMTFFIVLTKVGKPYRRWMIPLLLISFLQIYLSYSRGAWAGLLVALAVLPIVMRPAATPFILPTYLFGGLIVWFSGIGQRAVMGAIELADHSVDARFFLLQNGADVFAANLWQGVGLNAFARVDAAPSITMAVHNALFAAGTELGLPGVLTYGALMAWVFGHTVYALAVTSDPEYRAYLGALLVGLCSWYVSLQVNSLTYAYVAIMTLALAEATATTAIRDEKATRARNLAALNRGPSEVPALEG